MGHMGVGPVEEEMRIDVALNMYTFKRSSLLQSSVIAFLSRLKSDDEELIQLKKVFLQLNTSQTGFLTAEELRAGTENFKETFKISLGKNSNYEPDFANCLEFLAFCLENINLFHRLR